MTHIGSGPCSPHNNAASSCHALMHQPCHIENVIAVKDKEKVERNRLRLRVSIASVKWLASQACAFRRHDESDQSKNKGNFLEMVDLLAEFNPEIAKVVRGNAPYHSKYTSPEIQKEILSIYAFKIRKHIREEIGDSKFSILVDETCDVAKREQMALILRFVDKNGILQERFFDLIHVANTRSLTLKDELTVVLSTHGFNIQNLRGQGYDGASNMRGELNGLQALFLRECPYAYYVHCYAHRLQLALVDASKEVVPISQFFQKLIFVINTADSSSKRHDELHLAQAVELENGISNGSIETGQGANQILALKWLGDTRWGSHFAAVHSLMSLFGVVYSHIQDMAADGSTPGSIRADADTSFGYLSSFEFIFILCLMKETFEITEILGQAVQKKSQDIVNAVRLVSTTKQCLQELRSDDGYRQFVDTVIEFCVNHSIDIPDFDQTYILRGGRARHQPDKLTKEHYFRVEIFRATLDTQLFELNQRFNEKVMDLLSTSATLIPKYKFKGFKASDICEVVKKYYPADFAQDDIYGLQQELKHFVSDASKDEELKNISTLIDICRCLVETGRHTIYNLIDRLLRLLITLPVSTATAERAFSSMKIIKTKLRNKMEDDQMLINIEGEILENYSYDDIIEYFRKTKNRSVDL